MQKPGVTELADKAGISKSYACEILGTENTQPKAPSRALAIHIYRTTGWRPSSIEGLSDEQIAVLEQVEPWNHSRKAVA